VLDAALPDISGIEVCRRIKAETNTQDVFVALFSAAAPGPGDKATGLGTGADEYLQKPLAPDEFLARIRTSLRLRDTTAALRASEQHYRRLIEILPDAVASIDLDGRVTAANPQAVSMLGYEDSAELMNQNIFSLTLPENHDRVRARIARVLETGILRNIEDTIVRKDG
jgi:DNA-binding response OmpR family regulator